MAALGLLEKMAVILSDNSTDRNDYTQIDLGDGWLMLERAKEKTFIDTTQPDVYPPVHSQGKGQQVLILPKEEGGVWQIDIAIMNNNINDRVLPRQIEMVDFVFKTFNQFNNPHDVWSMCCSQARGCDLYMPLCMGYDASSVAYMGIDDKGNVHLGSHNGAVHRRPDGTLYTYHMHPIFPYVMPSEYLMKMGDKRYFMSDLLSLIKKPSIIAKNIAKPAPVQPVPVKERKPTVFDILRSM